MPSRIHGKSQGGYRLYNIWKNIRQRCLNEQCPDFHLYGGRGIKFCEEWNDFPAFENWALSSGYGDELTIERIDVDGSYSPENCTWIANYRQSANRRTIRPVVRSDGKHYATVADAARDTGIHHRKIWQVANGQRKSAGGFGWSYR